MSEAHVRIDEGIKRGPRKPRKAPAPPQVETPPAKPQFVGKLTEANPDDVIKRYLNGETSKQIAASYAVTRQGLGFYLRQHAPEPWKEAQIIVAIERKERAEDEIEVCDDALSLARAREGLRSAQWELERVFSRVYGPKQELAVTMDVRVQVDHALTEDAAELASRIRGAGMRQVAAQQGQVIDVVEAQQIIQTD